jgi:CheY-like chemotaxis protein
LTSHLLAFSRRQPLQPREVDINELLVKSARLLRPSLGEQIDICSTLADDAAAALVDPSQLTTAILNLALNARDAMPDGGRITLESKNVTLDADYADSHAEVTAGNYVMVAVSDTGRGIAPQHLDRIFEPFFTTKEVGRGTGLGLSMVYGFIKQSNGHIKVYSEVGHGTTVRIYLPRAKGFAQPLDDSSPTRIEGGDEAILIVEDDALVRSYVVTQVESLGYKTRAVSNAREALTVIDEGEDVDLLFTDVIMPGAMNGRELAAEAVNRRPSLKVLYTSGYTENVMAHDGRLDADVLLLAKPYRQIDLAKMIRTALAA